MKKEDKLKDVTLRDGSYAVNFQFSCQDVRMIGRALEESGINLVEIGHGMGLGASSVKNGLALNTDEEYLQAAQETFKKAQYGMFCIPEVASLDDIDMAASYGMGFIRIGTNVNEVAFSLYTKSKWEGTSESPITASHDDGTGSTAFYPGTACNSKSGEGAGAISKEFIARTFSANGNINEDEKTAATDTVYLNITGSPKLDAFMTESTYTTNGNIGEELGTITLNFKKADKTTDLTEVGVNNDSSGT